MKRSDVVAIIALLALLIVICLIPGMMPCSRVIAEFGPFVLGYAFSVVGPWVPPWRIGAISARIWRDLGGASATQERRLPVAVGVVERVLYTTSFVIDKPEFIGAWLVLKVAGSWGGWTVGYAGVEGRAMYQTFLIGTGISVAYGLVGAAIIKWTGTGLGYRACVAAVCLVVLHALLYWWVRRTFRRVGPRHVKWLGRRASDVTPDLKTRP